MAGAHAFLPPSSAHAWRQCPAWPWMNALYPQEDTEESMEGTAAHEVMELVGHGKPVSEGQFASNNVVVTEEMIEGAQLFDEAVKSLAGSSVIKFYEQTMVSTIHQHCWGTPDFFALSGTNSAWIIDVIDYKFGHGFVDEFENWQGVAYLDSVLEYFAQQLNEPRGLLDQKIKLRFTVVQPRCYYRGKPVRTWSMRGSDLRGYVNELVSAANIAMDRDNQNHKAITGPACDHCHGRHACDSLQKAGYAAAEFAGKATPAELSVSAASLELRMLERAAKRLDARIEGLRQVVLMQLRAGGRSPYYDIEHTHGRTKWALPEEQVIALGQLYGLNLAKQTVITPKQAEKLGVQPSILKQLTNAPIGAAKLVPSDDSKARRVFSTNGE